MAAATENTRDDDDLDDLEEGAAIVYHVAKDPLSIDSDSDLTELEGASSIAHIVPSLIVSCSYLDKDPLSIDSDSDLTEFEGLLYMNILRIVQVLTIHIELF